MNKIVLNWNHREQGEFPVIWVLSHFKHISITAEKLDENQDLIILHCTKDNWTAGDIFLIGMKVQARLYKM